MKKIIIIAVLLVITFGIWKYISIKSQEPSVIKEVKDSLEQSADYLPNAIDRKNTMENKIKDSSTQENERIKKSLEELQ
jgi:Sec-independent protein translocase protein TatA